VHALDRIDGPRVSEITPKWGLRAPVAPA
jgi:hypothetical protein